MERAVSGYMEVEEATDAEEAYDEIVSILLDVKSSFYRLDEIIEEIDRKHARYMRNAVMRAKFLLATGNNLEGKILRILNQFVDELNCGESEDFTEDVVENLQGLFAIYPQSYVSPESLQTIPVTKKIGVVDKISSETRMSDEERQLYKEALQLRNRNRFSRKNINEYVTLLLKDKKKMAVTEIPIESRRDLIRIIYISIYAGNRSNNYTIERTGTRVEMEGYSLPYFDIIKKE